MKKTYLAAVAAAALALPSLALAQDGFLSTSYNVADDYDALTVGGAVTADAGPVKLQFNVDHFRGEDDVTGLTDSTTSLAAHMYTQTDQYAVGGFVTGADVAGTGVYGIGGGGSWYLGDASIGGALSYNTIDNSGGHAWAYGVNGRYFFTENFVLGASYDLIDLNSVIDVDADVWGVEAEYKFDNPVSVFASFNSVDLDVPGVDSEETWGVGARFYFGGKSLKDQERSGAKAMRTNGMVF